MKGKNTDAGERKGREGREGRERIKGWKGKG